MGMPDELRELLEQIDAESAKAVIAYLDGTPDAVAEMILVVQESTT